ncbi:MULTISPECIES: hypothetical protein [unclassified Nocardioides]|uniref:hypothetical protein n=1 Tax=unclassified Nocardioides TaxID=2615069 RepID=UPI00360932A6
MIKKALAALVASAVMLAPAATATAAEGTGQARAAKAVTGTWKGAVYGDAGGSAGYPAKVKITKSDGKLRGKVTYPGVCSGKWVFRGKKSGWFTFREVITRGSGCVSPVSVKVRRDGKRLKVVWREPKTGDTASMRARRT